MGIKSSRTMWEFAVFCFHLGVLGNGVPKKELQVRTRGIMFAVPVLCSQVVLISFSPPQNLPVWPWSSNKMIGKGLEKPVGPR